MEHDYQINLYCGILEDDYDSPRYAFEAADPETEPDDAVFGRLAESLDTTVSDTGFDWNSQLVQLPDSLVQRIRDDAIREYQAGLTRRIHS